MIEQPAALPYGGTRPLTGKLVVNTRELAYSKSQSLNIPGMKPRQIAAEKLTYMEGLKHTLKPRYKCQFHVEKVPFEHQSP